MKNTLFAFLLLLLVSSANADILPLYFNGAGITDTVNIHANNPEKPGDTLSAKVKADTLIPVNMKPFFGNSQFLDRNIIDRINYKYTGDILKDLGFNYVRSHGLDGYPDETILFGVGNNGISYFEDGVLLNSRVNNNYDLNNSQSEYIDSIEVLPVTRGFLYGIYNNLVSVNFITKDFISSKPYSRIKYYQGPNGEAMIDAIFNQIAYKKLKFSVDVSNRKFDSSYVNSGYSQWQVRGNIKYYLSGNWNIMASYNYAKSLVGLNGGVNVDSIISASADVNTYLYDPLQAPVKFNNQSQSFKDHLFGFRILGKYLDNSYTDLNFYYNYKETELNNSADTVFYKNIDKEKLAGVNLQQKFSLDYIDIKLLGNYETGRLSYYSLSNTYLNYYPVDYSNFSISPIISAQILDSCLIPSIFFKYSRNSYKNDAAANGSYAGWGSDLTYCYSEAVKFYLGFSNYKPGPGKQYVYNYEFGAAYNSANLGINLKLFKRNNYFSYNRFSFLTDSNYTVSNLYGTAVDMKAVVWKVALEAHAYFYGSPQTTGQFYRMPKINLTGGVYYENMLFKNNLNLKTGISVDYIGQRNEPVYGELGPNFKMDFTVAGEIQKVAYVYFTWENLLDAKYYIIPYYPVPARNIRFGIAWELFN